MCPYGSRREKPPPVGFLFDVEQDVGVGCFGSRVRGICILHDQVGAPGFGSPNFIR
ncbi:MAG: hypothetical protein M3Z36_07555 [Acidobacteriota bacterium]|nr:hypothetical protein [Acidobacteriota bacterium]